MNGKSPHNALSKEGENGLRTPLYLLHTTKNTQNLTTNKSTHCVFQST